MSGAEYRLRAATAADERILTEMLELASNWRDPAAAQNPVPREYVEGFGRPGDLGVVAESAEGPAGAAWCRLMRGYGHVADDVPELAIGVSAEHRGQGLGSTLIEALKTAIAEAGYRAVSLSVEPDNPARRIYERAGFVRTGTEGGSWVMLAELA